MIEKSEYYGILLDKKEGLFIYLDIKESYTELRQNDKIFGLNLDGIEKNTLFKVFSEIKPGSLILKVEKCVVSDYLKIINDKSIISQLNDYCVDDLIIKESINLRNKIIDSL